MIVLSLTTKKVGILPVTTTCFYSHLLKCLQGGRLDDIENRDDLNNQDSKITSKSQLTARTSHSNTTIRFRGPSANDPILTPLYARVIHLGNGKLMRSLTFS